MPEQTAWLIELGSNPSRWWVGRGPDEFTPDASGFPGPMRFARRKDAERAIGWLVNIGASQGCKATEHIWLAASSSPVARQEPGVSVTDHFARSFADFERACLVHIDEEQRRANPDNALIALLCDAVRLTREQKP